MLAVLSRWLLLSCECRVAGGRPPGLSSGAVSDSG